MASVRTGPTRLPPAQRYLPPVTVTETVRYVEVAPSAGWQSMAKLVRDMDEERVRDTKEDIDTLLVFAGLFSAVLSAFLVETYQALQPDTGNQMLTLLERIATQNYTFNSQSGSLNVGSPSMEATSFEVPAWALRVNGLWFASLILSLATASLSMLVKSWLREYLAVDQIAPQHRLRARQYRYPALQKWRVFEIAASLPLLLQLSLAFFFIGLCFFTAEVSSSMGLTSIPLVSAWGFFVIMTTIAPIVSPRCPFKVFLFKRTLRSARRWVRPAVMMVWTTLRLKAANSSSTHPNNHPSRRSLLPRVTIAGVKQYLQGPRPDDEEEAVIASGQDDAELLLSTDSMMLDDSMLDLMRDALRQGQLEPPVVIRLVLRLMANRLSPSSDSVLAEPITIIPDVTPLSKRAYSVLMAMISDLLGLHSPSLNGDSEQWVKNAILLLMAVSPFSLPDEGRSALANVLRSNPYDSPAGRALARLLLESTQDDRLLASLSGRLLSICDIDHMPSLTCIFLFCNELARISDPGMSYELPRAIQGYHNNVVIVPQVRRILEAMWPIFAHLSKSEVWRSDLRPWYGIEMCFLTALYLGHVLGHQEEVSKVFGLWWEVPRGTFRAMTLIAACNNRMRLEKEMMMTIASQAFHQASPEVQLTMLQRSASTLQDCADGKGLETALKSPQLAQPFIDAVRLCLFHLQLYAHWMESSRSPTVPPSLSGQAIQAASQLEWRKLWHTMQAYLHFYWSKKLWTIDPPENMGIDRDSDLPTDSPDGILAQDMDMAEICLRCMAEIDDAASAGLGFASKHAAGGRAQTPFPDHLWTALGLFVRPESRSQFPRLSQTPSPAINGTPQAGASSSSAAHDT